MERQDLKKRKFLKIAGILTTGLLFSKISFFSKFWEPYDKNQSNDKLYPKIRPEAVKRNKEA